jgi:capsular polysaccharide biosynthesis protein
VANEPDVEALFRSRGFDVMAMAECPLAEQTRIFREARIIAGVSGAGLADLIFSPAGTHVIVLLSDSLIRWWADERGARSLWSSDRAVKGGQLAELGDSPRFYAHLAAACDQICHSFVAGDEMPLDQLARFLDDVLATVDAA